MRKEDRIRQQQSQNPSGQPEQPKSQGGEQITGRAPVDPPQKPPRPSGKLPLPD